MQSRVAGQVLERPLCLHMKGSLQARGAGSVGGGGGGSCLRHDRTCQGHSPKPSRGYSYLAAKHKLKDITFHAFVLWRVATSVRSDHCHLFTLAQSEADVLQNFLERQVACKPSSPQLLSHPNNVYARSKLPSLRLLREGDIQVLHLLTRSNKSDKPFSTFSTHLPQEAAAARLLNPTRRPRPLMVPSWDIHNHSVAISDFAAAANHGCETTAAPHRQKIPLWRLRHPWRPPTRSKGSGNS